MSKNRRGQSSPTHRNDAQPSPTNAGSANDKPASNTINCVTIDLGNTNTCIVLTKVGKSNDISRDECVIEVITNPQGNRQTPSLVSYNADAEDAVELLHGEQCSSVKPTQVYGSKKSLLSRTAQQLTELKVAISKYLDFAVHDDKNTIAVTHSVDGNDKVHSIRDLLSQYIDVMKTEVEQYIGSPINQVLISVPNEYTSAQRDAYAQLFSDSKLSLLQQPYNDAVLACVAYELDKDATSDSSISLVVDISHFAARYTLVRIDHGLYRIVSDVTHNLLYSGDNSTNVLVGHNIDQLLINHYIAEINKKFKTTAIDANNTTSKPYMKLRRALQNVKHILSTSQQTSVEIDSLYDGVDYNANITRSKYESIIAPLLANISSNINAVISKAQLTVDDIDNVVLVGGTLKIPAVQSSVEKVFEGKPAQVLKSIVQDECIALGGAKQASYIGHQTPEQLQQSIPTRTTLSLPIGIETANGIFYEVFPINSSLPATTTLTTTTSQNDQTSVQLSLHEGVNTHVADNHKLATLILSDIPPMQAGLPRVSIKINVDSNGNIHATATEHNTSATVTVTQDDAVKRFGQAEIDKHIKSNKHDIEHQHATTHLLQLSTLYSRLAGVLFDKDHDTAQQQPTYADDVKTIQSVHKYIQPVNGSNVDGKQVQSHLETLQTVYNKYFEKQRHRSSRRSEYKQTNGSSGHSQLAEHDDID